MSQRNSALLASMETPGERRERRLSGALSLCAGLLLAAGSWTASTAATHVHGGPAISSHWGSAVARSCESVGPVSGSGIGYWWRCTADVEWNGSAAQRGQVRFGGSELTPDDIGKTVRVTAEGGEAGSASATYLRDTTHPLRRLGTTLAVVSFLILFGFAGAAVLRLAPLSIRLGVDKKFAARLAEQYRIEGRRPRG